MATRYEAEIEELKSTLTAVILAPLPFSIEQCVKPLGGVAACGLRRADSDGCRQSDAGRSARDDSSIGRIFGGSRPGISRLWIGISIGNDSRPISCSNSRYVRPRVRDRKMRCQKPRAEVDVGIHPSLRTEQGVAMLSSVLKSSRASPAASRRAAENPV